MQSYAPSTRPTYQLRSDYLSRLPFGEPGRTDASPSPTMAACLLLSDFREAGVHTHVFTHTSDLGPAPGLGASAATP